MKKIYSLLLTAAALLVGTNVWAVDVATWAELQEAIQTPDAEINLTASVSMPAGEWDFNGATIICGNNKNNDFRVNAGTANGVYTLRNVTFKNYKYSSPKGALYTTKAGTGITLNLESSVHFEENQYDICLYNNLTVNNEATINSIYLQRGGTINNDGVIVTGVYGAGTGTGATTINNNAGASLTQTYGFKYAVTINNEGDAVISGGTASANMTANNVIISGGTRNAKLIGTDVTIDGGTFKGEISGTGYTITGGTFNVAPAAGIDGIINPGLYTAPFFKEGIGSLELADGCIYRDYDKRVIRNNAGLVEVTHKNASTITCLIEEAFANVADGDVITLLEDVTSYASLWLGTAEKDGAFKSVTLDLNGHTLYSATNVTRTITLTHGALYITGQGEIKHMRSNASGKSSEIIYIVGSPDRNAINPRNAAVGDLFVYLLVDEGVTLSADGNFVNGITVIENGSSSNTLSQLNYYTDIYSAASPAFSVANGVRVDVKGTVDVTKYAGKVNGNIRHPNEMIVEYPGVTDAQIGDTANSTFFHIFPTAVMHTSDVEEATAVYCSGYARWLIEGLCQGATGVYVKSGVVDLTDAIIESTWTGDANITTGLGSGVKAGGNAVVIESNDHYTGQQALVIGGDTKISTEANGGAAVVDIVDDTHDSKVESIVINGGSFTGDNAIVISSETASEQVTTVNGVTVVGEITVGGSSDPADVADIMGSNTHTTEIENPDGTTTVIISAGSAPSVATEWVDVAAMQEGSNANWTGFTAGTIANGEKVSLGELQVISGTKVGETEKYQILTIEDGGVLEVERLILSDSARIIVEAGGQLIVTGEQGINAPSTSNIVLKHQGAVNATDRVHATFLFNPAVTSNKHPNATVELTTYSFANSASDYQWERFGVPTHNALKSISGSDVPTAFAVATLTGWQNLGYLDRPGYTDVEANVFNTPFATYELMAQRAYNPAAPTVGPKYQFAGELVGNTNATLNVNKYWTGFTNSYSASIDVPAMFDVVEAGEIITPFIYIAQPGGLGTYTWEPVDQYSDGFAAMKIAPMQAFILAKTYGSTQTEEVVLNYNDMVYEPAVPSNNPAPARRMAVNNDFTARMRVVIANEQGVWDNVQLRETAMSLQNAEKYMNDDVNIYAMSDEKDAIYSVENLEDLYLGVSTIKGGNFTISFANVEGREFDLIDLETGARIAASEGETYSFSAAANTTNDYRFKLVAPAKMPTAIENTEVKANAKGIFTLTGQFLGEMNVWNTLPAGVYVVNGAKRVK